MIVGLNSAKVATRYMNRSYPGSPASREISQLPRAAYTTQTLLKNTVEAEKKF